MPVRLFIGNLPYAASEAELREHLSSVGEPSQIVLPVDRETGRPRGFAFVDYADRAVAEAAISRFDQQPFKGRPLAVSEARPREERPAGAPRPGGYGARPGAGAASTRTMKTGATSRRTISRSTTSRRAPKTTRMAAATTSKNVAAVPAR
ncbi:MAG: RNA-binding protein [Acidobacteria bacterium]|nr:RNA-binding protein [Acidobacteriota bacterium]